MESLDLPTLFDKFHLRKVYNKTTEQMEPHSHNHYEIFLFLSGNFHYAVDDNTYFIESGDILLINQHTTHCPIIDNSVKFNRIALAITPNYLKSLSSNKTDLTNCFNSNLSNNKIIKTTHAEYTKIATLFDHLLMNDSKQSYGSDLLFQSILIQLLILINSTFHSNTLPLDDFSIKNTSLIAQIEDYISNYFTEKISLANIADNFYLSKYHLARLFKEETNLSIYQYIQEKRIQHAKTLIHLGLSFNEIYNNCGFDDYSNFYRTFKKLVGVSPKEYKENLINK